MNKRRLTMAVLCAAALLAGAGYAAEPDSPVKFSVDLKAEWTDNRDSNAEEESNLDMYAKPRIDVLLRGESTRLDFHYAPSYRYRQDPSPIQNEEELQHDVGLNVLHKAIPRTEVRLDETFLVTDDPAIREEGTTLRRDCSYKYNSAFGGIRYSLRPTLAVDLSGQHKIKRYDDSVVAQESDEDSVSGTLMLWKQLDPTLGLLVAGEVVSYDYDDSELERGFQARGVHAGVEKVFSSALRTSLRLGWRGADYDENRLGSQSAPYASVSALVSPGPSTRITGTVSHMLRNSDVYPFASQVATELHGRLEWDASARVTCSLSATYRHSNYDEDTLPSGASAQTTYKTSGDEKTTLVGARVGYELDSYSLLTLAYGCEDVSSDVDESWSRNALSIALTKKF